MAKDAPLRSAPDAWNALVDRAGLQSTGWDEELARSVALALNPHGDIDVEVAAPDTTPTDVVLALLGALAPWVEMFSDLERLLAAHHLRATNDVLRIAFDFGADRDEISFDVDAFREIGERFEEINGRLLAELVDPAWDYFDLHRIPSWILRQPIRPAAAVLPWLAQYERDEWPRTVPPVPRSGHAALDDALRELWKRWRAVHRVTLAAVNAPSAAVPHLRRLRETGEDAQEPIAALVTLLEADGAWLSRTLSGAYAAAMDSDASQAQELASALTECLAELPLPPAPDATRALEELLALPLWGVRHELYSAWTLTQIIDAAGARPIRLHADADGALRIGATTKRIATIGGRDGDVGVWAEVRSRMRGESPVRDNWIRPDWLLAPAGANPVTDVDETSLVVECKQYKHADTRGFAYAADDYARTHSNALVILADCGPVTPAAVLAKVDQAVRPRIAVIGRATPFDDGHRRLRDELRRALDTAVPANAQRLSGQTAYVHIHPPQADLTIVLRQFEPSVRDTDLVGQKASIAPGRNALYVRKDEVRRFRALGARILIQTEEDRLTFAARGGAGRFWHVIDIDGASGEVSDVNRVLATPPTPPSDPR